MLRPAGLVLFLLTALPAAADDPSRVLDAGAPPADTRLGKAKTLNDYFPMTVPATKEAWERRRRELREQVLVGLGLWPLPERTPLNAIVHGKIDRDDYTVEKVYFASLPGHYVTGNLYRPKGRTGKLPGVLCPHGHWANGRFYDAGEKGAAEQIKQGAEKGVPGARYPLQARCVTLARMGCVVFHYDMLGYADSKPIVHREGFSDARAELLLQNQMGLQTWNSIRSLDFLLGLSDVDTARVGVTGASGGGTQTFLLCGIDERPTVAFPAVMVSTAMQGGCVCENCSYLRQGAGNIDLAALFAPKPQAMSGAKDWTIDIETKGLPELKAVYALYGAAENVHAKCYPQFGHNYNQVSRELMYQWFNKHLKLGLPEPVEEKSFVPVPPAELSVFNAEHPQPKDALNAADLRKAMAEMSAKQLAGVLKDPSADEYRQVVGTALRVMAGGGLPSSFELRRPMRSEKLGELDVHKAVIGRKGSGDALPALGLIPTGYNKTVTIWVHPKGKASLFENGKPTPAAQAILDQKSAIFAVDVLRTGELVGGEPYKVQSFAGYTFGYNRPLLAERVQDVLTAVGFAKSVLGAKAVHLVGWEEGGLWALLARGLSGDTVARTAVDLRQFRFASVKAGDDERMLPGAVKYGDVPGLAGLCRSGELYLHNDAEAEKLATRLGGKVVGKAERAAATDVATWLVR